LKRPVRRGSVAVVLPGDARWNVGSKVHTVSERDSRLAQVVARVAHGVSVLLIVPARSGCPESPRTPAVFTATSRHSTRQEKRRRRWGARAGVFLR